LTLVLCMGAASIAHAQSQQLYFVGTHAPLGSISSDGAGSDAVYLRWDVTEGDLPADVLLFRLERGGQEIAQLPATTVMAPGEIQGLYQGVGQDRRKREMVQRLDALQAEAEPPVSVTLSNFHSVLYDTINPGSEKFHEFFTIFASRVDFNVAVARHRGYLDTDASPGLHTYTLYASDGVTEVQAGEVVVNVAAGVHQPLPEAKDFKPVSLARCDAPEQGKDHGMVHLTWRHPGTLLGQPEPVNQFAASLMTAGYDLYRTDTTVASSPAVLDIRSLAAGVGHDSNGEVAIPGLVKVNDQPIIVAGSPEEEARYEGFNAPFFQVRDDADALRAAGFEPGDLLGYYVVARDFTGNYGDTAVVRDLATMLPVTVPIPDTRKPPAPWKLRTVQKTWGNEELQLVWDHVDVRNYYSDYQIGRSYCNLETARLDLELTYVPQGEDCQSQLNREVRLDVSDYLIYRFESFEDARNFADSDGDGVSDAEERLASGVLPFPEYSEPGTACDGSAQPGGADNYLVDTVLASSVYSSLRPDGRQVIEYPDTKAGAPIFEKSKVFWYRVASRTPSGSLSELSAPRRARARDREMPLLSEAPGVSLNARDCDYFAYRTQPQTGDPHIAVDATSDKVAHTARAECKEPVSNGTLRFDLAIEDGASGELRGAELSAAACATLTNECAGPSDASVSFFDANGELLDSVDYASGFGGHCPIADSTLYEDCVERPVKPGETLAVPPIPSFPTIPDCYYIYQEINGKSYKIETICPGDPPPTWNFPALSGEICLSWAIADNNNSVSTKSKLPCFNLFFPTLDAPQAVEFAFTAGMPDAALSFVPPERPVTGTILEWYQKGLDDSAGRSRTFQEHAAQTASDGIQSTPITLPLPTESIEEWCFRARSVAPMGGLSDWSSVQCGLRLPLGEEVSYLPWPKIEVPPQGAQDLDAEYLAADGRAVVLLSDPVELKNPDLNCVTTPSPPSACDGSPGGGSCFSPLDFRMECQDLCSAIQAGLNEPLHFVAYRQSKSGPSGTPSDFQQVSPVIDFFQCEDELDGRQAIEDPFIKPAEFSPPHPWPGTRMVFLDRFPHLASHWYRYQFVYLNPRGEITRYRNSDWIEAD